MRLTRRDYTDFACGIGIALLFVSLYFGYRELAKGTDAPDERLGVFGVFALAMLMLAHVLQRDFSDSLNVIGLWATAIGGVGVGLLCYMLPRESLLGMCVVAVLVLAVSVLAFFLPSRPL